MKIGYTLPSLNATEKFMKRPELFEILDTAVTYPVVTVVAGMGYGKTATIFNYLAKKRASTAWLQMSEHDNMPSHFWQTIVNSVSKTKPMLAKKVEHLGFPDSLDRINKLLQIVSSQTMTIEAGFCVVDNCHLIENKEIIRLIEHFASSNIENLTVILLFRHVMNISFSKLIKNNRLYSITDKHLRFSMQETFDYFKESKVYIPKHILEKIYLSTEGWPIAVCLAAMDIQRNGLKADRPAAYTNSILFSIIDKEIFSLYPLAIKRFLTKLALLDMDVIPIALMREIYGEEMSSLMELLSKNMFVMYDPFEENYQFHQIFTKFLKQHEVLISKEVREQTYMMAGTWYEDEGLPLVALHFYQKCANYDGIWRIIRYFGPERRPKDIGELFISLIDQIPESYQQKYPLIKVVRANLLLNNGQLAECMKYLEPLIKENETHMSDERVLGELYLTKAICVRMSQSTLFVDYFKKAARFLPQGSNIYVRNSRLLDDNIALRFPDNKEGELEHIVEKIFEAQPFLLQAMNQCSSGYDYLAAAEASLYQVHLKKAEDYAFLAIYQGKEYQQYDIVCNAYFVLIRISTYKGNYEKVMSFLKLMKEYIDGFPEVGFYAIPDMAKSWFYCMINHPEKCAGWIANTYMANETSADLIRREDAVRGLFFIRKKQFYQLLSYIDCMQNDSNRQIKPFVYLQTKIMQAVAYHLTDENDKAVEAFYTAYEMTYANNMIIDFIEFGAMMCSLLQVVRQTDLYCFDMDWLDNIYIKASAYSKRVAFVADQYDRFHKAKQYDQVELTEKEKEILRLLCDGLTREEIADYFNISVYMIKTLLKVIYEKLGAINRADAVRIAFANHIIE